ncbi:NTE family protein [Parafrankia irregularis]|uniref:NTE family protein n=2 Tax=Frankiaceae TaxID=74712 RepID=A0A0S4QSR4_9ACTN|nr:patatin-like phospholipase family protein [Parafrankia sp. CH37]CUU58265.1 NTE family protein [Parafrankia irregularis]
MLARMTFSAAQAVVLGPGGLVGMAWLFGLAAGLRDEGVDLADADLIVGTSAGAIAGAALASGGDLRRLAAPPESSGPWHRPDPDLMARVRAVLGDSGLAPAEARRRVGRLALTAPTIAEEEHVASMEYLVGAGGWPQRAMLITTVDLDTGEPVVWDRASAAPLARVVAASCAMPGAYPPVTINGRRYVDGALAGGSHPRLAAGAKTIVLVEPFGVDSGDVLVQGTRTIGVVPDDAALAAIGTDVGDHTRWVPAFEAGLRQAPAAAGRIRLPVS